MSAETKKNTMTPLLLQSEASAERQAPSPCSTLGKALRKQKRLILESKKKWLEMTIQHGGGWISTNYKAGDQEEEKHESHC